MGPVQLPIKLINVEKHDQESYQIMVYFDLHMRHRVGNAIAIYVSLKMYKPQGCSDEIEEDHPSLYLSKIIQYAGVRFFFFYANSTWLHFSSYQS